MEADEELCNKLPYNIITMSQYEQYKTDMEQLSQENLRTMLTCINKNINLNTETSLLDTYKDINNDNETSKEMNRYSLYLYNNDLIYTYSKFILLIILGGVYFYFFKITGIDINTIIDKTKQTVTEVINKTKAKVDSKPNVKTTTNAKVDSKPNVKTTTNAKVDNK
jgi:hypothetical protein